MPEEHAVALCLGVGEGGGEGDGAGDQAGGGGQGVGQGLGHSAHLGHGGQHGVDQGCHHLGVTPQQPEGASHQGGARLDHGAR